MLAIRAVNDRVYATSSSYHKYKFSLSAKRINSECAPLVRVCVNKPVTTFPYPWDNMGVRGRDGEREGIAAAATIPIEGFRIVIIIVEWRWKLEWKMDNNNNTNSDEMIMKCGVRDCVSGICDHP